MEIVAARHPDLTCFRWLVQRNSPASFREAENVVNTFCAPALSAVRSTVRVESAYVSKHPDYVWLTVFASLGDSSPIAGAMQPFLSGRVVQVHITSDIAREELLQSHCDSFRFALDLVTRIALEIHTGAGLADHQRALVAIGVTGRADLAPLDSYLRPRSPTYAANPDAFLRVLNCNCLTGQTTDVVHWLYNVVLGVDCFAGCDQKLVLQKLGL
jgi:hypothetical protein